MELQEEVFENQVLKYWKIKWKWKNKSLTHGLKYKLTFLLIACDFPLPSMA